MIFSGPPAGLVSPFDDLPGNMGSTGSLRGGAGVAAPCGDWANNDIGGETNGDSVDPFFSGVNILYHPSFPAPNDGCFVLSLPLRGRCLGHLANR